MTGNHDKPRLATRVGPAQARVGAVLLLTLRGTPTLYYGEEIGMSDALIPPEQARDPAEQSRDPQRTPMQWSNDLNAGFTRGRPWLDVNENYSQVNVEAQRDDPGSMLTLYRRLIGLRRQEPALHGGDYWPISLDGDIFAYLREDTQTGRRFLIVANFGHRPGTFSIPDRWRLHGKAILSTHPQREGRPIGGNRIDMADDEAIVVALRR